MNQKQEVNFTTKEQVTLCPLGGKSYSVSVKGTCSNCPFVTAITPKDSEKMIPPKVHCEPPIKHQNVIFEHKEIEWNTLRNKKE